MWIAARMCIRGGWRRRCGDARVKFDAVFDMLDTRAFIVVWTFCWKLTAADWTLVFFCKLATRLGRD